jgi:transcriptional regulator with XRE-family HTH domain
MTTAQLIRGARRESNLTQQALADRSGATQPSIADIERSAHDTFSQPLVTGSSLYRHLPEPWPNGVTTFARNFAQNAIARTPPFARSLA